MDKTIIFLILLFFIFGCEEEEEDFTFRFEGTVTNESGLPINNARVDLIFNNVFWKYGPLETTETNSEGKYRIFYVVENSYIDSEFTCVNNIWKFKTLRASAERYRGPSKNSLKCTENVQIIDFTLEKF